MASLDAQRRLWLTRTTRFCGAAAAILSEAALLGWILGWPDLESLFTGDGGVHIPLAVCLLLMGRAVFHCVPQARRGGKPTAIFTLVIAAYTLLEYALGRRLLLYRILPPDPVMINPRIPGHMTLLSAINLALVGASLLTLDAAWKGRRVSNALSGLAWAFSLLGLVNHLYGASLLTGGMDMPLAVAVIFLLLTSGILAARPGLVTNLLLAPGAGGQVARRFFPAAILVPILLGWLRIAFERFLPTIDHSSTTLLVISICAVFSVLIAALARRIEETSRELERAQANFQTAVANIKEYAIILLDAKGRVATWNAGAQALKGYAPQEIIGRHYSTFFSPEDTASGRPAKELEIAAREGRFEEENWRVRKDGSRFWADVLITAMHDESGQVSGFVKVTRDMTLRRRAEEELREAIEALRRSNQELENFAYVASHDLQEPLRKVISFTQLFAQRYQEQVDETASRYISHIVDGAQRMQRLIADLLAYSRLGGAGAPVPTDLSTMAASAWNDLAVAVRESGARLDLEPLPRVNADPQWLLQLFENLLSNAIKFRKKGESPVAHVRAETRDGQLVVSVADNGIGIEPRYHDQIFAMFRRLHSQSEYPGTGIGLAICKRVVEQLGGKIWVESEPGKGSIFRFTIPEGALR